MNYCFFTKLTILTALCMFITLFGLLSCQTIVYEDTTPTGVLMIDNTIYRTVYAVEFPFGNTQD